MDEADEVLESKTQRAAEQEALKWLSDWIPDTLPHVDDDPWPITIHGELVDGAGNVVKKLEYTWTPPHTREPECLSGEHEWRDATEARAGQGCETWYTETCRNCGTRAERHTQAQMPGGTYHDYSAYYAPKNDDDE